MNDGDGRSNIVLFPTKRNYQMVQCVDWSDLDFSIPVAHKWGESMETDVE